MNNSNYLKLSFLWLFIFLIAPFANSQNAYYDSYKITRILTLKDLMDVIKAANYNNLDSDIVKVQNSFDTITGTYMLRISVRH